MVSNSTNAPQSCCTPERKFADAKHPEIGRAQGMDIVGTPIKKLSIPGGIALVGTSQPILPIDGEGPLRKVRVEPFQMDETTVTNARFMEFIAATGYRTEAEVIGNSFVFEGLLQKEMAEDAPAFQQAAWWRTVDNANWKAPFGPNSLAELLPDHPVVHVSWNDANAFAKWAGGRLPTEAEWEHAARGGLGDVPFPWGDREPNDHDYFPCNIWQGKFPDTNLQLDGYLATAPAKSFEPNAYGLYNMVGNIWQWTSQPFKIRSLKKVVREKHAGRVGHKIMKGGSFLCHVSYCYRYRIAARTGSSPNSSTSHLGFRLVYDTK